MGATNKTTMKEEKWKTAVEYARRGNENLFNSLVNEMYISKYYAAIQKFTKDEALTREVYTRAITKFWERFVLKGESLPSKNLIGYIYNMSRNVFIDLKRQDNKNKECELCNRHALNIARDYILITQESGEFESTKYMEEQCEYELKMKLLQDSIAQLDERCQEIIRRNIFEGELLKDLKQQLGFSGTYQSIVEKKKRCMRRLSKLMFSALEETNSFSKVKSL